MKGNNKNPLVNSLNKAAQCYFVNPCEASSEKVIKAAEGLIRYFARLYGGGCCKDDLFQTGSVGLMKALKNYDPSKETSFITYASHAIMGEIRHLVRKEVSYYRPGCIVELQYKVDQVIEEYTKVHGDVPTPTYIAQNLKIKEESVIEVMKAGFINFEEIDSSNIQSSAYETFLLPIEDKLTIYHAFKKLSDIQQKVINMLYLNDMTQQQVAVTLGLSQRQVSRVKERGVQIMRDSMGEDD
jgi:RNA polymerase sigma factor (sigma-70 family)